MAFSASDSDGNGKLDYVEWITPHLSNQSFDIILITMAEHLDAEKAFIEDVTETAKTLDENYTPEIPDGHYVRAVFEVNLTNKKDITLYARSPNGGSVQVYEKDSEVLLADFGAFGIERERKPIFLTNLSESYDNETEILTENGWKLFSELQDGEKVLSLNQETGEREWQLPKDRQEFDNKGKMYLILLDDGSEMRVSEKHKVYSSYILKLSSNPLGNNLNPNNESTNNLPLKL